MTRQELQLIDLESFEKIKDLNLAFPQDRVAWLTLEQISYLNKKQLSSLSPLQSACFSSKQIRQFSLEQILCLPEDDLPSFLPRMATKQICDLSDSSHIKFKESLLNIHHRELDIIVNLTSSFTNLRIFLCERLEKPSIS
ncbi:MAG: hypothetical protein ACI9S8_001109 [Chlamydiales bacterium]|jgi:hypothetical protein